jgi:hypothetical protein
MGTSGNKPILCKKNKDTILRGSSLLDIELKLKEIEFPELKNLLDKEKKERKNLWMQHMYSTGTGPQNVNLFDTYKGMKFLLEMVRFFIRQINFRKNKFYY